MKERTINLNADVGESFGAWTMGDDEALLRLVGSANIACGFHAGDPLVMRRTVRAALAAKVSLGAHPSFPDLQGFGRRPMQLSSAELEALLIYQIGALAALARAEGGHLTHVKPHGALSNIACEDRDVANSVVRAIHRVDPALILLAPALSELLGAGQASGLPVAAEIFADRTYTDAGQLTPRSEPGSVLHTPEDCVDHVLRMVDAGGVVSRSGKVLPTPWQSICVHGDSPVAVATAAAIRRALLVAGCHLSPLPEIVGSGSGDLPGS